MLINRHLIGSPSSQHLNQKFHLVTPAVKFAIRAGKKQIHSAGNMEFSISSSYVPTTDTPGPHFINYNQFNFQTKFPKRKITQSVYQIVLTGSSSRNPILKWFT